MPSTFRIPRADLSSLRGRLVATYSRRAYGQVADVVHVGMHHPRLMTDVFRFESKVAQWDALDPHLKSFAQMASAAMIGCSWCLDFGYYLAHTDGLDEAKVRELTEMVAIENLRSRFNSAAGLASQGFSDVCELPLATAGADSGMMSS